MTRDRLLRSPRIAQLILIVGAIIYFGVCWPLYGRRGFPEKDPFWLAMIWLWGPPVFLSAIYQKWCRKRACDLILYALAAGFVLSWGTIIMVPSNKTAFLALLGLVECGPLMIICVLLVEGVSRRILALVRYFPKQPYCESCGYCLRGLTVSRCPECGKSFSAELLDPSSCPVITPVFKRWTTLLFAMTIIAAISFPFIYRAYSYHSSKVSGEREAEADWVNGNITWFVTEKEIQAMTPEQKDRFYEMMHNRDSSTDFQIDHIWSSDWRIHTHQSSYRNVIERKLHESGRACPTFE